MNLIDRLRNWKRKLRWDRQYKKGKWDGLKDTTEACRYQTIISYMKHSGSASPAILDLGCGEGVLNEHLPPTHPYSYFLGIDYSKVSIDKATAKGFARAEFCCEDMHFFTPRRKFDIITFNEAFYYINPKERANVLRRMLACLQPGGIIITSMYRDAGDCWAVFDEFTERIAFAIVETSEENKFWKVGALRPRQ